MNTIIKNKIINYAILFTVLSFIIKGSIFYFFIEPNKYFVQPDTSGYLTCAHQISSGNGMYINSQPVFLRSPGYPAYLAFFYRLFSEKKATPNKIFMDYKKAWNISLWFQILLCSFIPVLIGLLAYILFKSYYAILLSTLFAVFNLGFNLYPCYIHTEALSLLLFLFFLIFLCKSTLTNEDLPYKKRLLYVSLSALFLGLHAWIRPQIIMVLVVACLLIFIFEKISWRQYLTKCFLFSSIVFALMFPWCIRNYNLVGSYFMSSAVGPTLLSFPAAQVIKQKYNCSIKQSISTLYKKATLLLQKTNLSLPPGSIICKEAIAEKIAFPILLRNPFLTIYIAIKEILKTMFDPYASQFNKFRLGTFDANPLEETFQEKYDNTFNSELPNFIQAICCLDFLYLFLLWIGFFGQIIVFAYNYIKNKKLRTLANLQKYFFILLFAGILLGVTGVTEGGSRFRIPTEPLLIIVSSLFWASLIYKKRAKFN